MRGCIKGIKALGKYVDLKRLNTTGVSAGCTSDLLVSLGLPCPPQPLCSGGAGASQSAPRRWDGP